MQTAAKNVLALFTGLLLLAVVYGPQLWAQQVLRKHNRPRDERGFHGLEWHEGMKLTVTKGKHTLKLTRQGPPPRIRDVKLTTEAEFPKDWKPAGRKPNVARVEPKCRTIFLPNGAVDVESLRIAVQERIRQFGPERGNSQGFHIDCSDLCVPDRRVLLPLGQERY